MKVISEERGPPVFNRKVGSTQCSRDNAEHPPLGRWLLGIGSTLGEPFEVKLSGRGRTRLASMSWRAALLRQFRSRPWSVWSPSSPAADGALAPESPQASALLAMPRVFARAHLGALDTFLSLFWTAALLAGDRPRNYHDALRARAGVWSLALLTKIHAWFLADSGIWALVKLRGVPSGR